MSNPHEMAAKFTRKQAKPVLTSKGPRTVKKSAYLTNATAAFAVDGTALPDIDFDLGESYAGTLPISSNADDYNRLWFWFFPSDNPKASDEITIWLNGGPGCSSLDGLFQENGPFQWQSGTYAPIKNPYSWVNLTNMIWIDQPVSTGFSPGNITINNEHDVTTQFMGFWKNFMTTFGLQGRKVYITGESYAGQYIPYIASGMLDANDTTYYNVKGIQINDPSINDDATLQVAPAVPAVNLYNNVLNLNESTMTLLNNKYESCGYKAFMEQALTFPPAGKFPTAPSYRGGCDLWDDFTVAATYINPCYNVYHVIDFCPFLWDELGFPSLAGGPNNYFNQSSVQKVLHAPPTDYSICGGGDNLFPRGDKSVPSGLGPLASVIERTNNVLVGHGLYDFLLFANGTLATLNNLTFNGAQGFSKPPTTPFYVPYHHELLEDIYGDVSIPFIQDAGAGYLGSYVTERGLTFCYVNDAGHEIPQYSPGAGYRHLEFLLGRISSLSEVGDFTTQTGNFTGTTKPFRRAMAPGEKMAGMKWTS
ncbi:hypothetical protein MMC25_004768 [Agyrium rufum]|nr:hypothetical protein [Agyrium rufum]